MNLALYCVIAYVVTLGLGLGVLLVALHVLVRGGDDLRHLVSKHRLSESGDADSPTAGSAAAAAGR